MGRRGQFERMEQAAKQRKLESYARFWDDRLVSNKRSFFITEVIVGALERYVKDRIPTGDFLRGVLENDLEKVVCHGDTMNMLNIRNIVMFCRAQVPIVAQGSADKVNRWIIGVEEDQ